MNEKMIQMNMNLEQFKKHTGDAFDELRTIANSATVNNEENKEQIKQLRTQVNDETILINEETQSSITEIELKMNKLYK